MKKLLLKVASAFVFAGVIACFFVPGSADAQVPYVGYCCDALGVRRCVINPTPVGNACFCYQQGWGFACL